MTAPDPGRRRALAALGVGVAAAAFGTLRLLGRGGSTLESAATTTTPPTMAAATTTTPSRPPSTATTAPTTSPAPTSTTTTSPTSGAATIVTIIGRDGWEARPAGDGMVRHTVDRITVHHTAAVLEDNADAPAHIRGHQRFHQDTRGWPDLAYHFVVDAAGNVYEGRNPRMRGDTATDYDPTGHLLVCCEGNFDVQPLPDAQFTGLVTLLAWGVHAFGVGVATIAGHGDYAATSCPGADLDELLDDGSLRRAVRAAEGRYRLEVLAGDAARVAVAGIEAGDG